MKGESRGADAGLQALLLHVRCVTSCNMLRAQAMNLLGALSQSNPGAALLQAESRVLFPSVRALCWEGMRAQGWGAEFMAAFSFRCHPGEIQLPQAVCPNRTTCAISLYLQTSKQAT